METLTIRISPAVQAVRIGGELVPLPPEAVEAITEIIAGVLEPEPDTPNEAGGIAAEAA